MKQVICPNCSQKCIRHDEDFRTVFGTPYSGFTVERLTEMMTRIYDKREFYRNVFTDCSQNSIYRYIQEFDVAAGKEAIQQAFGREASKEEVYGMKYHSYGSIAMLVEWLRGDLSSPR